MVIFYVINLHTVANHTYDDNHYYTAVNIINCKHVPLKLPPATKCLHQPVMKPILPGEESHRELCTKFLLDCVCNSVKKAIRCIHVTFVYTADILVSVKKRLPAGLASWSAAPASSPIHVTVCGVAISEFTLNHIHYSPLIIFTAMINITVVSHGM